MRRAVLATTGISALVVTLLALKPHQTPTLAGVTARPTTTVHVPSGTSTGTGTFTGDPIDTQYGTVQVAATLADGKITAVKVLQAPDQNGRDQRIAAYALPRLTQEALGAQSARIDAISGASYTSQGYIQSLQSALDRAHA
ncbi:FMN-binding protein [Streptomyces xanthochromogenes]|uniref:FMN-binding protein n=1 Tax=Streptomyces xanthochromogenes TaxID=67384 RepID=UPI0016791065|nr:FMN-binding protein [Streptomyces xanthochromogenes]GHB73079.1 FMN-binding protein [Streptomyces xanthochromogenes]